MDESARGSLAEKSGHPVITRYERHFDDYYVYADAYTQTHGVSGTFYLSLYADLGRIWKARFNGRSSGQLLGNFLRFRRGNADVVFIKF